MNTIDILEQMRGKGWFKRTVTPTHYQYKLGKMPDRSDMDLFMRMLHSAARTTSSYSLVQPSLIGEFFYQVAKPKPNVRPRLGTRELVITDWPEKEVKALINWIVRDMKAKWQVGYPLERIVVNGNGRAAHKYGCNYDQGARSVTVRVGTDVAWPRCWMEEHMDNWHDCFVLAFAWVYFCHMRDSCKMRTRRGECQEVSRSVLHRYRVAHIDMDLVLDKADYGITEE